MAETQPTTEDASHDAANRYRAPALDRGLDILEALAAETRGLTRAEICEVIGVSASQMYRMLERLIARGYVARLDGGDRFTLTMKLFHVATGHPPERRLLAQAQPLMDAFAVERRQSCHLAVPAQASAIILAQASTVSHWEFRARVGASMDFFNTSSGLTLLAFQHPDRLEQTLGVWGVQDAGSRLAAVRDQLDSARARGWRIAPSAQVCGITDISVPVAGPNGDAIAALTCAYLDRPGDPIDGDEGQAAALASLVRAAETLSMKAAG